MPVTEVPEVEPWSIHRAIIEQAQDAVIFIEADGVIRLWNRGAEIIFGYGAPEVIGRDIDVIIPERFRHAHAEGFRRALAAGNTHYNGRIMTTRASHKFVSHLYVDMSFGMLKDRSGVTIGAFAIARDCTTRHLEAAARKAQAQSLGHGQLSLH
jgi:PAS domain S-box-containing protein